MSDAIKRAFRRRSAVEPVIGHLKVDHRMDRNHLAHSSGDAINAVLAAVGYNFRLLIRWLTPARPARTAVPETRFSALIHGRLATGRAIKRARGLATRLGVVAAIALAAVFAGTEARATDWYTGAAPPPPDENWIVAVDPSISFTTNSSRFEGVSGTFAATDTLRV